MKYSIDEYADRMTAPIGAVRINEGGVNMKYEIRVYHKKTIDSNFFYDEESSVSLTECTEEYAEKCAKLFESMGVQRKERDEKSYWYEQWADGRNVAMYIFYKNA